MNVSGGKPRLAVLGATRGVTVARSIRGEGRVEIAALCDIDPSRLEQKGRECKAEGHAGLRLFDQASDLFDWGEFDAVVVATPDHTHAELAVEAFQRGFHCFVEKPMANRLDSARELVRAWQASGNIGVVGHEYRYHALIRAAKERIQKGDIGQPRLAMTVDFCGRMGSYWRRAYWRKSRRGPDNSLTLQKAIHQLDIQSFLVGDHPTQVFASGAENHYGGDRPSDLRCSDCTEAETCPYHTSRVRINGHTSGLVRQENGLCVFSNDTDLHDNQVVAIDYRGGARGTYVECFFTPEYRFEHTVIGDKGRLFLRFVVGNSNSGVLELSYIGSTRKETIEMPCEGGHGGGDPALGEAFAKALRNGVQIQPDIRDGFHAVALAVAIDASRAHQRPEPVASGQ